MKELTQEIRAELKARHGDNLYLVETSEGLVVIKPSSRAHWDAFADDYANPQTAADATVNLMLRCAVWPSRAELTTMAQRSPGVSRRVMDELEHLAGGSMDVARNMRPTKASELSEEESEELSLLGLTNEEILTLKDSYPREGQIEVVRTPRGPFVIRCPSSASYDAYERSLRQSSKVSQAMYQLALDAIVWPNIDELRATFDAMPGLYGVLMPHLQRMAGLEREARAKKI